MTFENTCVIYISRDIERALGRAPGPSYHIVTNHSIQAESVKQQYPDHVTLIKNPNGEPLDTAGLLQNEATRKLINDLAIIQTSNHSGLVPSILVFKNTPQIEEISRNNSWKLLNPSADLSEKIENKITQIEWLGDLTSYLPNHELKAVKDIKFDKKPFIVQWAHGHTGDGTILVEKEKDLNILKDKFPDRVARVSALVSGPSFTVNVAVNPTQILMGNISYQITGLEPFTDNRFSTIGNDWSLTHSLLSDSEIASIEEMVKKIGTKMQRDGWLGLFGLDIMRDDEQNKMVLIEINARQPASTTFESFLQEENRLAGITGVTMFEAHLLTLLGQGILEQPVPLNDGAQIVQRITKNIKTISSDVVGSLELSGHTVIEYPNTTPNSDLLRIQGPLGIMETHGQFNSRGKEIISCVIPEKI